MRRLYALLFALFTCLALVAGACGDDGDSSQFGQANGDATTGGGGDGGDPPILGGGDASADPDGQAIAITPADQIVTFVSGMPAPSVQYVATTTTGVQVPASYTIDRGEIGTVGLATGLFTASGAVGGKAVVTASWNGKTATTTGNNASTVYDRVGNFTVTVTVSGPNGTDGVGQTVINVQ
jgi:hypothetical protein